MKLTQMGAFLSAAVLTGSLIMGCAAPTSHAETQGQGASQTAQTTSGPIVGGWEMRQPENIMLTNEERALWEKTGAAQDITPVAVIATQVVAGTNYAYLTWHNDGWHIEVVYEDLAGNASITSDKPLTIPENPNTNAAKEGLAGGWTAKVAVPNLALQPKEAFDAFSQATENDTEGAAYYPIALLGSQIVAGTNHAFLCGTLETGEQPARLYLALVYVDLDGNASLMNLYPFNVTDFV